MRQATAERNGGPARDAEAAVVPAAVITPTPPPGPIAVFAGGTGVVIQYTRQEGGMLIPAEGGGVLHQLQRLAAVGPGLPLRQALHAAVDDVVDDLEEIGRAG